MNTANKDPEKTLDSALELLEQVEELIDEVIDLEECAKGGKKPPHARAYRFKVNETICISEKAKITGREILEKAELLPPKNYTLRQKMAGGVPKRIELDDIVNLREPGIEKFRAIRKEQTEGEAQGRRAAPVLDQDRLFLERYGLRWEVIVEGFTWVLLHGFPLPAGFNRSEVTVAVRVESGYPMAQLDMMYVFPPLARTDGQIIKQSNCTQALDGKQFQRWSRHRTSENPWVVGEDSLETHVYLIEEYFRAECAR